ncbi:gamma-glutamyltransferase family protein [Staphylothermus hellenicus]|uniref:Gamma-glutamyltranspeptidase n=1 Tax=Staphylothermus hellenicus (strain DSM 12710 / JCM 10830 / BK20S6-10-b1 / P8) TaxID=591019 RepID=D7D9A3_STAHD|nr:gamma-glutamyltransferase family protein [Staphylothermus hellenicus]ADI32349.1 gamma-glutamyltranspeptidase [Staphylothermus hellenicus DSM 12710]
MVFGVIGREGVSSQIYTASLAGLRVLENGGNAFDAAIAVSSVLSIMLPYTGGIGGDGFLLAKTGNGEIIAYNGSGRSSRIFPVDKFILGRPERGPLTITVPGLVDLWDWVWENYGSKDPLEIFKYAISLAENGFYVSEQLNNAIHSSYSSLQQYSMWKSTFGAYRTGDIARLPRYARVLKIISRRGFREFYEGKLAEEIIEKLRNQGVPITYEDFSTHKGEPVNPLKTNYKGYKLFELPPNTQGITTLELLKLIEYSGINTKPYDSIERIIEFFNLAIAAYDDRDKYVADPSYYRFDPYKILSRKYLVDRIKEFASNRNNELTSMDTTFFITSDRYGNIVGFIQSIFYPFGSGIVVEDIPFQNRAIGFTPEKNHPNSPAPRKRPKHTLSILLAENDEETYIIGCAGGDLRPQIHSIVFTNIVDYNMSLAEAIHAPRYIVTKYHGRQILRAAIERSLGISLNNENIKIIDALSRSVGNVQAIKAHKKGYYNLAADLRGGGIALAHN